MSIGRTFSAWPFVLLIRSPFPVSALPSSYDIRNAGLRLEPCRHEGDRQRHNSYSYEPPGERRIRTFVVCFESFLIPSKLCGRLFAWPRRQLICRIRQRRLSLHPAPPPPCPSPLTSYPLSRLS